jgi:hypothetical protein
VASRKPLHANADMVKNFKPYADLPTGEFVSQALYLGKSGDSSMPIQVSSLVPVENIRDYDAVHPEVVKLLDTKLTKKDSKSGVRYVSTQSSSDKTVVEQIRKFVADNIETGENNVPPGWKDNAEANSIVIRSTDWVLHAQETFAASVAIGATSQHTGETLVGPLEGPEREAQENSRSGGSWTISDAPLFTDAKPNADIYNMK